MANRLYEIAGYLSLAGLTLMPLSAEGAIAGVKNPTEKNKQEAEEASRAKIPKLEEVVGKEIIKESKTGADKKEDRLEGINYGALSEHSYFQYLAENEENLNEKEKEDLAEIERRYLAHQKEEFRKKYVFEYKKRNPGEKVPEIEIPEFFVESYKGNFESCKNYARIRMGLRRLEEKRQEKMKELRERLKIIDELKEKRKKLDEINERAERRTNRSSYEE